MTDNKLYFNPKEWKLNEQCTNNRAERSYITGLDGKLVQIYTLGDWGYNWTEIYREVDCEPDKEYTFTFWLNGGENDRYNETCQFRICYEDGVGDIVYKLNRNTIPYKKHINGWYLYEIPFVAEQKKVIMKFVSMSAYMSVMPALDVSEYDGIVDDHIPQGKPQRHNIIFSDGWPTDKWYKGNYDTAQKQQSVFGTKFVDVITNAFSPNIHNGASVNYNHGVDMSLNSQIRQRVSGMTNELVDEIVDEIMDEIEEELRGELDGMKYEIIEEYRQSIKEEIIKNMKVEG